MTHYIIKNLGIIEIDKTPKDDIVKGMWMREEQVFHYFGKTEEEIEKKIYEHIIRYLNEEEKCTEQYLVEVRGLQLRATVAKNHLAKSYNKSWLEILADTPQINSGEEK